MKTLLVACLLLCWSAAGMAGESADPALAPPAPLHEQVLMISGDPGRPVDLEVTVYMPDGPGPFPLAVMNHGSSGGDAQRRATPRYRYTFAAYYFLSRGYAVALPMMRGFAGSGGALVSRGCDLAGMGLDNARDIAAVITALASEPRIDASRIVVAGQSFGGWNTLALGALHPPGVRGLVNFVGGLRSTGCADPYDADQALIDGASALGARTPLPSIWFYGDNDRLFSSALWHAMIDRYRQAGGRAELVPFGIFMDDSHEMLSHSEALAFWTAKVDAFLARIGLHSQEVDPRYLPLPSPRPSHFAAIDDVSAVPRLNAQGRAAYQAFLDQPVPRAFVITLDGKIVSSHGGFDPLARALGLCRAHGWICHPYAIDHDVVWRPSR